MIEGDATDQLARLPDSAVDAIVTDPPYGIGFADHPWDNPAGRIEGSPAGDGFSAWTHGWARECLRVLKPGGLLLAFGAPRTVHRLATGIEQAGFELRDQLLWLYGSGVPKQGLDPEGRSGCLKPGYEPILLARAPLAARSARANAERYGTGLLRIDDTRVPGENQGRWPANILLSHSNNCRASRCDPDCPAGLLDRQRPGARPSRFFYCSKPSSGERDAGCEALPLNRVRTYGSGASRRNPHPTVKPVELMRWLVRLVSPPGGLVCDPFAGSGSTGIAALAEQRRFLGIERDSDYARIARARLTHQQQAEDREGVARAA